MSAGTDQRYREAMQRTLDAINAAQNDAVCPRTTYPLARRLWWRVFGVPADVRRAQLRERKQRATLHLEALTRRRLDRCT